MFNDVLSQQKRRVDMYATETYKKAKIVGSLSKAIQQGSKYGIWVAHITNASCEICINNNGKQFSLQSLLKEFPPHINCNCNIVTDKGVSIL